MDLTFGAIDCVWFLGSAPHKKNPGLSPVQTAQPPASRLVDLSGFFGLQIVIHLRQISFVGNTRHCKGDAYICAFTATSELVVGL